MDEQYKCGFCGFLINSQCENLWEHECFQEYSEEVHQLVSENGILTVADKIEDMSKGPWEELLIKYVQDRPPLYNIKLPVAMRSQIKKNQLWEEIFNLFHETISVEDIKGKWKYLRDCYLKAKKKINKYVPSGSAAQSQPDSGFRFFSLMKFLDDAIDRQPTVCSVSLVSPTPSTPRTSTSEHESGINGLPTVQITPTSKKRKVEEKNIHKAILDALETPNPLGGLDGFLTRLGESLKRFPLIERSRIEIDIMQLVYNREMDLSLI